MKFLVTGILLAMQVTMALPSLAAEEKKISWAFDPWSPLHEIGEEKGAEAKGLLVEIMKEILEKKLGYTILFRQLPWKRCQEDVKKGVTDFMLTTPTFERRQYALASDMPILNLQLKMYVKPEMFSKVKSIDSIEALFSHNLIMASDLGNGWFTENIKNKEVKGKKLKFYEVKSYGELAEFIHLGRADSTIQPEVTFDATLRKKSINLKKVSHSFKDMPLHFLLSKKSKLGKEFLQQFSSVFLDVKKNGGLEAIEKKYIN